MECKEVVCPVCRTVLMYWTTKATIACSHCKATVAVEPMEPAVEYEVIEDGVDT